ncbi:DUF4345 domain-containing protein [Acaryochloris marina]|uniref:DUF4345 domain-containing protein n=1 Tax=Acaryochloris marina (strain MBIC 11017) TaxID=329726 RepID=B0CDG7_ACAM1|nr:DUF4345 domain-containing protein [Acaryochloris marina]ABW26892.1 conserved hypothetical protein [Acaryochloris marina MBIC11017]BDM81664.1 hypothetical protein AM10699_45310 [Acaryochloris marina MBIC10699]
MKRGLQIILGILSLIPFMVAILGLTSGLGRWLPAEAITPEFDSHYRYITGFYISLGVIAWWIIPNIEKHKTALRIVAGAIFAGGVGRVISFWQVGAPGPLTLVFTGIELCFPLLLIWQAKLPRRQSKTG